MAKQSSENEDRRKRRLVDLDDELARKLGVLASLTNQSVPDLVNNLLRPIVDQELPKAMAKLGFVPK